MAKKKLLCTLVLILSVSVITKSYGFNREVRDFVTDIQNDTEALSNDSETQEFVNDIQSNTERVLNDAENNDLVQDIQNETNYLINNKSISDFTRQIEADTDNALRDNETTKFVNDIENETNKIIEDQDMSFNINGNLIAFVSLSMPEKNLHQIASEVAKYDGVLVLRGLKDNSFKKTAKILQPIINDTKISFNIDPETFKEYNITQVPSYVLEDHEGNHDKMIGNVTIPYFLEQIRTNGDTKTSLENI